MEIAEDFEEFVAVVEHGSISAAARALDAPRATLSRRLARLEERLGVRLLRRSTRSLELTAQGRALYPKARLVLAAAREAEQEVRRLDGVPRGLLRLSTPLLSPEGIFTSLFAEFMKKYPEVELEVVGSAEHVDLAADGFDLALRAAADEDDALVARTLSFDESIAVAAPAYLCAQGRPETPEELATHECLVEYRSGKTPDFQWPLVAGGSVRVSGRLTTNQVGLRLSAAKQGLGIALVSRYLASPLLDAGELVQVLPGLVGRQVRVVLAYAEREFLDPKVRAFLDFVAPRLSAMNKKRIRSRGKG